jgi:predicted metal-dependent hydrolase
MIGTMSDLFHIGEPPIPVHLSQSARARRYSLRISNKDGTVRLTIPHRSDRDAALRFAMSQELWLRKHLAKRPQLMVPTIGQPFLFEGRNLTVASGQGRAVRVMGDTIAVPGHPDQLSAKLRGFLKAQARDRLVPLSDHYADLLGRKIGKVSIRDTRSRWGSCSSEGNLMYSWRLIMAPPRVLEYVAAHEACHLIEMNHSDRYWAWVAKIFPDYQDQRTWLRKHGQTLHQVDFT